MKVLKFTLIAAVLAIVAFAATAKAQEPVPPAGKPLLSIDRASLGAGLDYAFYGQQGDQPLPDFKKSFEVGLFGAYVLTPHLTLTASSAWDVDNRWLRSKVGLRTVLWRGRE